MIVYAILIAVALTAVYCAIRGIAETIKSEIKIRRELRNVDVYTYNKDGDLVLEHRGESRRK